MVKSFRQDDKKLHAARCAWQTEYFQTPGFETAGEPFGLSVDTQAKSTAKATIKELRASSPGFSSSPLSIYPLEGLGDEAWTSGGEVYVLKGDTIFLVTVTNYDTGVEPYPDVDTIAQQAAALGGQAPVALSRAHGDVAQLARAPALQAGGRGFESHRLHHCMRL